MQRAILSLTVLLMLVTCKSKEKSVSPGNDAEKVQNTEQAQENAQKSVDYKYVTILSDAAEKNYPKNFNIDTAWTKGDILSLYLTYSGGCQPHDFDLFSDNNYMKSLPLQLNLFLEHNNNNDHCRRLIKDTLEYDISDIQHPENKTLMLRINNYEHKIPYKY